MAQVRAFSTDSAAACDGTLEGLGHLLEQWPQTPAADIEAVGLDKAYVHVQEAQQTVMGYARARSKKTASELVGLCASASSLTEGLEDLVDADENAFKAYMRQKAIKVAKAVSKIQVARESAEQLSKASASGKPLDPEIASAAALGGKCSYFVSVYTALTFYRTAATWTESPAGKNAKNHCYK